MDAAFCAAFILISAVVDFFLALAAAVAYLVCAVVSAALKVAAVKRTGLSIDAAATPVSSGIDNARSVTFQGATEEPATHSSATSDLVSADPIAIATRIPSASVDLKEIDIDTGAPYVNNGACFDAEHDACIGSALERSSHDMEMSSSVFDEDDSCFFRSEASSDYLESHRLDVDWELESIASVDSSAAILDNTDYILGGESFVSDDDMMLSASAEILDNTDYILGGESYDSEADDSSIVSTDLELAMVWPSTTEDESKREENTDAKESERMIAVLPTTGDSKPASIQRCARTVSSDCVSAERQGRLVPKPFIVEPTSLSNSVRIVRPKSVATAPVQSRALAYTECPRYIAKRKASKARIVKINQESAAAEALRLR